MKVSAFTFIKNGQICLDIHFYSQLNLSLEIVDEFVINVGESEDETFENEFKSIDSIQKFELLNSKWNDSLTHQRICLWAAKNDFSI